MYIIYFCSIGTKKPLISMCEWYYWYKEVLWCNVSVVSATAHYVIALWLHILEILHLFSKYWLRNFPNYTYGVCIWKHSIVESWLSDTKWWSFECKWKFLILHNIHNSKCVVKLFSVISSMIELYHMKCQLSLLIWCFLVYWTALPWLWVQ